MNEKEEKKVWKEESRQRGKARGERQGRGVKGGGGIRRQTERRGKSQKCGWKERETEG